MSPALREEAVPTTPTYCTVNDVYRILQKNKPGEDTGTGKPGKGTVQDWVLQAEDVIDRYTGHAWRERKVVEEYPDGSRTRNLERFFKFWLSHRSIRTLDSAQDVVDVWTGDDFEDYLTTRTKGRAEDFYVNRSRGVLYIRVTLLRSLFNLADREDLVRVTYRYGEQNVPAAITRATALLAAAGVKSGTIESLSVPQGQGADKVNVTDQVKRWRQHASKILGPHVEVGV